MYESYFNQTNCHICKKRSLLVNTLLIKIIVKLGTTVITQVNAEVLHVAYVIWNKISKEILVIFHGGFNSNYDFIIKELAKKFEKEFSCLREKTKKYKTFSVPVTEEAKRTDQNGKEIAKTMS